MELATSQTPPHADGGCMGQFPHVRLRRAVSQMDLDCHNFAGAPSTQPNMLMQNSTRTSSRFGQTSKKLGLENASGRKLPSSIDRSHCRLPVRIRPGPCTSPCRSCTLLRQAMGAGLGSRDRSADAGTQNRGGHPDHMDMRMGRRPRIPPRWPQPHPQTPRLGTAKETGVEVFGCSCPLACRCRQGGRCRPPV